MSAATATGRWPSLFGQVREAAEELKRDAAVCRPLAQAAEELRVELIALRAARSARRSSAPGHSEPPASNPATPRFGGVLRVLLVEDDALVASAARRALEGVGCAVMVAQSGPRACALLDERPDVIVLDLDLGTGCTGLSVAREARQKCPLARVVLWTGLPLSPQELEQAKQVVGASAVVMKGVEGTSELLSAVVGEGACAPTAPSPR